MDIAPGITKFIQTGTGAMSRTYTDVLRETIRATDFSGANAGLRIQAAIAAAPATGAVIDGLGLQGAQTSSVNPFSGITKPITLLLGDVTLSSSVQWAITSTDQDIIGISRDRTQLVYTGGALTDFLLFDGTAIGNGIRFILKDISVHGNANVVNAIAIKKAGRFTVDTVAAAECTGSGFNCLFCVLGEFINPAVSSNFGTFVVIPDAGITFDWIGADNSSANTIINPLMEGITGGIGIREIHSQANVYLGGTSEANGTGIDIAATASHLEFHGLYMEANTTQDIINRGFLNEFIGCRSFSAVANSTQFTSTSYLSKIVKGVYDRIVLDSGSQLHEVDAPYILQSLALTDSGTDNTITNVRTSGGAIDDKKPINVRELHVRSQSNATPTQLIITAHPSAQGATNIVTVRDAAGADVFSIAAGGAVEITGTTRHLDAILGDPNLFLQPDTGGVTVFRDDTGSEVARVTANNLALSRRLVYGLGATVAAANVLTLGVGGNVFQISGNTQINGITAANWSGGPLFLLFTGTPTVKHNTGGGGTAPIFLQGSADLVAAANTVLMLIFDGANWHEVSRKTA